MDSQELIDQMDRSFSRTFLEDVLRLFDTAYRESKVQAIAEYGAYAKSERPQIRVGMLSKGLDALARKNGLKVHKENNSANNYTFPVIEGTHVFLMFQRGRHPKYPPVEVEYVKEKVKECNLAVNQLSLLNTEATSETHFNSDHERNSNVVSLEEYRQKTSNQLSKKPVWLLSHGESVSDTLNYLKMFVPDADDSKSWLAHVDLFSRHLAALRAPEEEIIQVSEPVIRARKKGSEDS